MSNASERIFTYDRGVHIPTKNINNENVVCGSYHDKPDAEHQTEYIRKDIVEEKIIDGLKRAKKSYEDKIDEILQPIRDVMTVIGDIEWKGNVYKTAINETLRRGRG